MGLIRTSPPLTVLLLLWVWFGRSALGGGGWSMVLLPLYGAIPALLLLATQTRVVAHASRGDARRRRAHARAVIVLWLALLVGGATLPDVGDAPGSANSVLSLLTGIPAESRWAVLTFQTAAWTVLVAWLAQLALLATPEERKRRRRR